MFNISNSFGEKFVVTDAGESHGPGYTIIVEGTPSNMALSIDDIQIELDKRKPGSSKLVTERSEDDQVQILSGVFEGKTTGMPITLFIPNSNQRSKDYSNIKDNFRPGHADFTTYQKYQHRDHRGGGRSSARQTISRVAAGAIAKKIVEQSIKNLTVKAYVSQIGHIKQGKLEEIQNNHWDKDLNTFKTEESDKMTKLILETKKQGDSLGSKVKLMIKNLPAGVGGHFYSSLKANLSFAIFSIPAVQALEFGSGTNAAEMYGSQHNDSLTPSSDIQYLSNNHGGILGGISSGSDLLMTCTLKPPSSISKSQTTISKDKQKVDLTIQGRHDPCLAPRFCPVAEAMIYLTIVNYII